MEGQLIRYFSVNYLSGMLTLDDMVTENDEGLTTILDDALSSCQEIPFMAIDNGKTPDECEEKVSKILSGTVKSFKMEHIKAFPFQGYHTEKKSYLRIYTNGTGERKKAIQTIQENNFETASDDMWSFHRKIA
ncbi:unnamed protein product [Rhizophagus irregularis]|nr:unnamed protein product [Rhizophagus irregularis]